METKLLSQVWPVTHTHLLQQQFYIFVYLGMHHYEAPALTIAHWVVCNPAPMSGAALEGNTKASEWLCRGFASNLA